MPNCFMPEATDDRTCAVIQVNPQFYSFRWITLLLTQEFPFPDVVRLWDTLLSDPAGRTKCLLQMCVAMLSNVRAELLQVALPPSSALSYPLDAPVSD